jgi:lipopolysaccharide/colanic/teichoic acid biosynthesis glycosyltransferase
MIKRAIDILGAGLGLVILAPVFLAVALLVKLSSPGPVFFRQKRIGQDFRPFLIYKFRTMQANAPTRGPEITLGDDPRITRIGRYLRRTKIDELPQLINVVKGEMSLVGPRPEVPKYVELFRTEYADIVKVRPGMTDLASLKYRDEQTVLAGSGNPEERYASEILPDKIMLGKEYIERASLFFDLGLIVKTIGRLLG